MTKNDAICILPLTWCRNRLWKGKQEKKHVMKSGPCPRLSMGVLISLTLTLCKRGYLPPFHRCQNWDVERLHDPFQITKMTMKDLWTTWIQVWLPQKPVLSPFITVPGGTHMPAPTGDPQPTTVPYSGSLAWFKNFSDWSLFAKMKSQPSVKWAPLEKTLVGPQNPEGSHSDSRTVFEQWTMNNEQWWRSSTKQNQSQCLVHSFHRHVIPSLTEWR